MSPIYQRDRSRLGALFGAGAGIFIGAYDAGAISVALPRLVHVWHLSALGVAILGSAPLLGMVVGSLGAGFYADRWGRRTLLIVDFFAFGVAALGSAAAPNLFWFVGSRWVIGIGIGADYAVVFPYLAELMDQETRGKMMALTMWMANFGMVSAYILGALVIKTEYGWRIPLAVGGLLAAPLVVFRQALPESRLWLKMRGDSGKDIWHTLRQRRVITTVAVSSANWFSYQVSDQGLSLFLPTLLMGVFGSTVASAAWHSILVKLITIPAATATVFLIDRWGRRPLQIFGFLGRAVALMALGTIFLVLVHPAGASGAWKDIMVALLVVAYALGAMGPDKTTVIISAEQLQTAIRSTGQGIAEASGRLGGMVGVGGYSLLAFHWGPGAGLWFFGVMTLVGYGVSSRTLQRGSAGAL